MTVREGRIGKKKLPVRVIPSAWMGSMKAARSSVNYSITLLGTLPRLTGTCSMPSSSKQFKTWNSESRHQHLFPDKAVTADKINKNKNKLL